MEASPQLSLKMSHDVMKGTYVAFIIYVSYEAFES